MEKWFEKIIKKKKNSIIWCMYPNPNFETKYEIMEKMVCEYHKKKSLLFGACMFCVNITYCQILRIELVRNRALRCHVTHIGLSSGLVIKKSSFT